MVKDTVMRRDRGVRKSYLLSIIFMAVVLSLILAVPGQARMDKDAEANIIDFETMGKSAVAIPFTQNRSHRVGNVWMTITNWGILGSQFRSGQLIEQEGPYAGFLAPSFEFPAGSGINYLFWGALWFGAIVGEDTLVSTGTVDEARITELYPTADASAAIIELSNRRSSPFYSDDAVSEQDYIAVYTDTLTNPTFVPADPFLHRPHKPLGIQITQKSYSWAYDYAQDFILIDFVIHNIGNNIIEKSYMGLFIDADCWHENYSGDGSGDDYSGYLHTVPSPYGGLRDTVNIAWTADNDGDPSAGAFDLMSPVGIAGTRVVRGPAVSGGGCGPAPLDYSFNWWTRSTDARFDWGPSLQTNVRNFGTGGSGTPSGDLNKYYIMSNGEFDYDQLFSAVDFSDSTLWKAPKQLGLATSIADGTDTRYLFSFGPLPDLDPGDSTYITMAYVAGDGFHVNADDFERFFEPQRPDIFYSKLDFSDFAKNAQWSAWVFDNPGVDTDGDGCYGLNTLVNCRETTVVIIDPDLRDTTFTFMDTLYGNCDTIWYAGDGVPDFKGPPPPPSPILDISARPHELTITWTGEISETSFDNFTFKSDFEGYRVYIADFNALTAYTLVASWDIVNFRRFYYNRAADRWTQTEDPFPLETLQNMYPDYPFEPDDYPSPDQPFVGPDDSMFYFIPQDWNRGNEFIENGQIVSNAIQYLETDSLQDSEGNWKRFGHYECTIRNLLPSQPFYVAVTTFDFGDRETLAPLESSPLINATPAYASSSAEHTVEEKKEVIVYPNPYKTSDNYRGSQYEDREKHGWSERSRRIHFINLPARATIKIFTLDGDLVRQIEHPDPRFSDTEWHCEWDLITRNTQAACSGIYIWSVESELGNQIGKLVIIK